MICANARGLAAPVTAPNFLKQNIVKVEQFGLVGRELALEVQAEIFAAFEKVLAHDFFTAVAKEILNVARKLIGLVADFFAQVVGIDGAVSQSDFDVD